MTWTNPEKTEEAFFLKCAIFLRKYVILSWKFDKIFELVLWYFAYLFYMKFTLNQKIQKFGIGNPKFRGISQWEILMIAESLDNHMNDMRIYANWKVSNSRNSAENLMHVILSPNYAHSASNTDVMFTRLAIANKSI